MRPVLLDTLTGLAAPPRRTEVAAEIAHRVGASRALFFVRDPELGVLLPPEGFPQTVAGGLSWRAFLKECRAPGRYESTVELPVGAAATTVLAVDDEHVALVLLGGPVEAPALLEVVRALPLIGAIFRGEQEARVARGEAAVARTAGRRAHDLANALDGARREVELALAESARLNDELQGDDRRKDEFLAMLGHELRNPMAAIGAALAVLRSDGDVEAGKRALHVIERQSAQLTHLVDDLLEVARVSRGKIELRLTDVAVDDAVRSALESANALITKHQHTVEIVPTEPLFAHVDRARLEQMVTNLLTNAAKYTSPGGLIRVVSFRDGADAVLRVEDNGIGIIPSMLVGIFDPFVQVAPTIDRGAGGLGIGLTLVRRLALLHGGSIEATSEVGVGSVFTLRLPAAEPPAIVVRPLTPAVDAPRRKSVLVIDDNDDATEMMMALVEGWGHDVRCAADGPSGVALAAEWGPDVVLLDIGLPGMDGYEVARRLRVAANTRDARILAVSGYGQEGDQIKSREAGCDDHLVKPVDLTALRRALER